ncbi:hypothetical protein ACP70R_004208 [Stipagrostis hirtigluma subsp. patula]
MAAPAPPLRSWTDLPGDVLYEVLRRVQCGADRGCAALACRPWRDALGRDADPPAPLPWLLLPSRSAAGGRLRACCVLSGGSAHGHPNLDVAPPGPRCFGSHDGAWLFRDFRRDGGTYQLLNVHTGHVYALPSEFEPFSGGLRAHEDMVLLAATLSAPPGQPGCVAAGIIYWPGVPSPEVQNVALRRVVLWRMGMGAQVVAQDFSLEPVEQALDVEDVIYHRGAFQVLTKGEDILAYRPLLHQQGSIGASVNLRCFLPRGRRNDDVVHSRYLVVSGEELLMVVRFSSRPPSRTREFRVFRVVEPPKPAANNDNADTDDDDDPNPAAAAPTWSELDTLGGRVLFVGRGCSRAYEANQYEGLEEGVYFLDDSSFYDIELIAGANARTYACVDNGKWSERGVESCFPSQEASDYSPPAWLLP